MMVARLHCPWIIGAAKPYGDFGEIDQSFSAY